MYINYKNPNYIRLQIWVQFNYENIFDIVASLNLFTEFNNNNGLFQVS